jgi:hypothetical protein
MKYQYTPGRAESGGFAKESAMGSAASRRKSVARRRRSRRKTVDRSRNRDGFCNAAVPEAGAPMVVFSGVWYHVVPRACVLES